MWRRMGNHRMAALPHEHGSWVFLLSPLAVGLAVGGRWTAATPFLVLAAVAAFLLRQPLTLWVKVLSGRRARRDAPAARLWTLVYLAGLLFASAGLWRQGLGWLAWLAVPASP